VFNKNDVDYFDMSAGISYKSPFSDNTDYYIGAALYHINSRAVGFFEETKIMLNKKTGNQCRFIAIGDLNELIFYGDYIDQLTSDFERVHITTAQL
jgi:hypothetical protein